MYEELVKVLRNCVLSKPCDPCPYYGPDGPTEKCATLNLAAADAIEELQQIVDHYKGCSDDWYKEACDYKAAAPKWIPVTERLPEEDKLVLVWRNNGLPYVSRRIDLSYWVGLGRDAGVTHWMPLPEPPKEET